MFHRAPSLSVCLDLARRAPMPEISVGFAERILTSLARGPEATWAWGPPEAPLLVGAVVDTCTSMANVADFFPVAGTPELPPEARDEILRQAEGITAEGPRRTLEMALLPELASWRPTLEARGYHHAYTLQHMFRGVEEAPAIVAPWVDADAGNVDDYHRVVQEAFSTVPGAMISSREDFTKAVLANVPPPRLIVEDGRVVAFVRVEKLGGIVEIASLGRDPAWRGKRLGDTILAEAIRLARTLAPTELRLTVATVNTRALELYERWGFRRGPEILVWRRAV